MRKVKAPLTKVTRGSPHPSGKPVRHDSYTKKASTIWRIPCDDYVTPRLRHGSQPLSLVGFHTSYAEAEE